MKTIYSLKEFHNEVLLIAKSVNEDYVNVEVRINHEGKVGFTAYIHKVGVGWYKGDTMEEVLSLLKNAITTPNIKNIDVEIDITLDYNQLPC